MSAKAGHVAIAGWTNVGKSTLLNRLVGEKIAAVADVPQTTRHRILGVLSLPSRGQIVFIDTPGFHHARERLNRAMVGAARGALGFFLPGSGNESSFVVSNWTLLRSV